MYSLCLISLINIILLFFDNYGGTLNADKHINEFVVEIPGGYSDAISVATQTGFKLDHKMIGFDDLYVFKHKNRGNNVNYFYMHRVKRSSKVQSVEQQVARKRVKRAPIVVSTSSTFNDPFYNSQWYLMRSKLNPKEIDMNVIEAWNLGYSGKGVVVCILDDGIDYRHPDLKDNYDPMASYDLNGGDNDPLPNYHVLDNRHGTRCAGEVSSKANNSECGVGVAFNSRIGAVRMLDGEVTDRLEAEALSLRQQHIDIYSGSWGPDDNGQRVEGPARLAKAALQKGVKYGRNGLGNIYVWASGNGGSKGDSCACDGYASSIYTLSVSGVTEKNTRPWYLESCASTLITTYSSGGTNERKIITTDMNLKCALDHTGTSASAPLAAGIIALMLEANPKLTWRDVQYITVVTANTAPFLDANFIINGANRKVSNYYGFGLMDAGKMVRLGKLWQTLPPQHICRTNSKIINIALKGVFVEKVSLDIDGCSGKNQVNYIEHVLLYLNVEYQNRGNLQVHLTSPAGTRSELLPYRKKDLHSGSSTFDTWPLMSVQFWGERGSGKWIVEIRNQENSNPSQKGILIAFAIEIYGTDKWPMRLRAPDAKENDNWFQQFERYVVADASEVTPRNNTYSRGHADTSNRAFKKANIQCHDQCYNNTCNGWGPQHCISCKKFQTYDGVCVEKCPSGTYLNTSSLMCDSCHFSCDECFGYGKFNCSRCHVGDSSGGAQNQCEISVKGCPEEFFKDKSTCTECPSNCSVCTSHTHCSQCKNGLFLTLNSQCKPTCDLGSYPDPRSRCRVCHINCLSCINGSPNECTSCKHGSFLLPTYNEYNYGKCISECIPGYFTNHTSGVCYRCHQNCKTCSGHSSGSCMDCIPPLELSETGHTCIDPVSYNCKPDEFKSSSGGCDKCPLRCKTCIDNKCTSCHSYKRFLFNNSCTEICPEDHFSISKDNICLPCKSYCNTCNPEGLLSECDQCVQNTQKCRNNCNPGQYWNDESKSCKGCHESCLSCDGDSSKDCITCSQSYYLSSSKECNRQCPRGQRNFIANTHKLCIPCHSSCKNFTCEPESGRCQECPQGHIPSLDGHCERIITCPMGYFWNVNETSCELCNQSCRSCSQYGPCTSCPRNHCLHPSHSSCHPCCSPFSTIKHCFKCKIGKEFCNAYDIIKLPSQMLIFQFPVLTGFIISILVLFAIIMLFFYRQQIVQILKKRSSTDASMKYTKLKNNSSREEYCASSSEDLSDSDTVLFRNTNNNGKLLSDPSIVKSDLNQTDFPNQIIFGKENFDNIKVNGNSVIN